MIRLRRSSVLDTVPSAQRRYLETGDSADTGIWIYLDPEAGRKLWSLVGEALVTEWVHLHPGTRPWAWWEYVAPEPRRRTGGTGDVFHTSRLWFGVETNFVPRELADYYNGRSIRPADRCHWNRDCVEGAFTLIPLDPNDPPTFESEAGYLARLGLLEADERRRIDSQTSPNEAA